ncbi:regulator of chromosome condensation 1/beta-lactamase-inhibitor protein II, partial [Baffinella frigidus]
MLGASEETHLLKADGVDWQINLPAEGGFVKCWGHNGWGNLGYGDTRQRGDGGVEMGASTPSRMDGGFVKCWGYNAWGQLGYQDTRMRGDGGGEMGASTRPPVVLEMPSSVVLGETFIEGGFVKCWGQNTWGNLGYGDTRQRGDEEGEMGASTPSRIEGGFVKCWGLNDHGQLGYGDTIQRGDGAGEMGASTTPRAFLSAANLPFVDLNGTAVAIACGEIFTCALLEGGFVKCWGANDYGQLGYGDTRQRGDEVGEMGVHLPAVDLAGTAVSIELRELHSCAVLADMTVKCWGNNGEGQLGYDDNLRRGEDSSNEMGAYLPAVDLDMKAVMVTGGGAFSCALLEGGLIKCWGYNGWGQLGQGDTRQRGDNGNEMGERLPTLDFGGGKAADITLGEHWGCVLLLGGRVKCWGYNGYGQLGYQDTRQRGDGGGEMGAYLPVVDLGGTAVAITAGHIHACAILEGGIVKCWGHNNQGQLGYDDNRQRGDGGGEMGASIPSHDEYLPAVDLGGKAVAISCGSLYTCAMLEGGFVKCWGQNNYGQLGYGDTSQRGDQLGEMGARNLPAVNVGAPVVAIVAGVEHTCVLLQGGFVKCWGRNDVGQLGYQDTRHRGNDGNDGEMGAHLPTVDLDGTAVALSLFERSTCALLEGGFVKCWGLNNYGQLGYGDTRQRGDGGSCAPCVVGTYKDAQGSDECNLCSSTKTTRFIGAIDESSCVCPMGTYLGGTSLCEACPAGFSAPFGSTDSAACTEWPSCSNANLLSLDLNGTAVSVAMGFDNHACALLEGGFVKCWGRGDWGNLGYGDTRKRGDGDGEMGASCPSRTIIPSGWLLVFLPVVDLNGTAVSIVLGRYHSCAIISSQEGGFVKCWGHNGQGQLGYQDTIQRGDGSGEMGTNLPAVDVGGTAVALALGELHSCVLLEGGFVKCWGYNNVGQLGQGDTLQRGSGGGEMGVRLPPVELERPAVAITAGGFFTCVLTGRTSRRSSCPCRRWRSLRGWIMRARCC